MGGHRLPRPLAPLHRLGSPGTAWCAPAPTTAWPRGLRQPYQCLLSGARHRFDGALSFERSASIVLRFEHDQPHRSACTRIPCPPPGIVRVQAAPRVRGPTRVVSSVSTLEDVAKAPAGFGTGHGRARLYFFRSSLVEISLVASAMRPPKNMCVICWPSPGK